MIAFGDEPQEPRHLVLGHLALHSCPVGRGWAELVPLAVPAATGPQRREAGESDLLRASGTLSAVPAVLGTCARIIQWGSLMTVRPRPHLLLMSKF